MRRLTKVIGQLAAVSALLAGCSGATDGAGALEQLEQEGIAVQTSELKNGTLFDGSAVWNGAVKVEFWHAASSTWLTCSGQVVSGRTILTAAHCITQAGVVGNPVSTWVRVYRPAYGGPGWWTVLPQTWAYVKYNPAFDNFSPKNDVGLVIAPNGSPFQNVFIGDALAISKTAPNNTPMNIVGYGYYDTNSSDGLGRSGAITPTYVSASSEYTYGITSNGQPQPCKGDSGGPLKTTTLVHGVLSQLANVNGKCGAGGRWATTKDNLAWLKSNILATESCTETASQYRCW